MFLILQNYKMAAVLKLSVTLCLFVAVLSKKLHLKVDLEEKNKDAKSFMNLFNDEDIIATNERYARHMDTVTESVLDHLIHEIKHQYFSEGYNSNSPVRRLIRNLNRELKRNEHNKMMKEKQKKKNANKPKSKTGKKNKKGTSSKQSAKIQQAPATKPEN